jgi:hypothetical protein
VANSKLIVPDEAVAEIVTFSSAAAKVVCTTPPTTPNESVLTFAPVIFVVMT